MTEIPTFATFYEYRGERLLRRSGGGDYQRVAVDGELTLARFPEALEFSSDPDDPWVMLPTWAFDAWYQQTVRGRWHGVPVEVVSLVKRGLNRGLVNLEYDGVRPDEAVSAGLRGDQYFGWSATVPPAEVEDITVELTKLAISERYSRRRNGSDDRLSSALLADAIVAFVGRGTRKIPTADEAAVFALDPQRFDEVFASVKAALKVSDSIVVDESDRGEVTAAVVAKHRELLPDLNDRAIDALLWRWGYITFHG